MRKDKEKLDQKIQRIKELAHKLEEVDKLHTYWVKMFDKSLIETRIRLSSQQGILTLKEKNCKYLESIKKCNIEQLALDYEEFERLERNIEFQLANNSSFKVAQIVAMKTAKKNQMERVKES